MNEDEYNLNLAKKAVQEIIVKISEELDTKKRVYSGNLLFNQRNVGILDVSIDHKQEIIIKAVVFRLHTDYCYNNYLTDAGDTKESVLEWLADIDGRASKIADCWKHLSDACDDFWSEH